MKKGFLAGMLLFAAGSAFGQGAYAGLHLGYGFGLPNEQLGTTTNVNSSGAGTESVIYGTYGGGFNSSLNVGYMFNEHVGAELGLNYLMGNKVTQDEFTFGDFSSTTVTQSNQFRVNPSLVITNGGKVAAYGKLGFVIPVAGSTVTEYRDNAGNEQDIESAGSFSLGYQGALGVSYSISDKLSIFGEISGVSLRIKSKSQSITKVSSSGIDILPLMSTYAKETVFVDELSNSSNNSSYNDNFSTDAPKEELANTSNYNAQFINIGVKFNF